MARRKYTLDKSITNISQSMFETEYTINLHRVKQCGTELQHITQQTTELCLEAVKQDGLAIEFVNTKTHNIMLEAVRKNGLAILHIKDEATPIIWFEAFLENKWIKEIIPDRISKTKEHKKLMIEYKLKSV